MERAPGDVVRYIAQQNPSAYRNLSIINRKFNQTTRSILPKICDLPVTGNEIARYIDETPYHHMMMMRPDGYITVSRRYIEISQDQVVGQILDLLFDAGFTQQLPDRLTLGQQLAKYITDSDNIITLVLDDIQIRVSRTGEDNIVLNFTQRDLSLMIDLMLKGGFKITELVALEKIYHQRLSCLSLDPKYASKMLYRDALDIRNYFLDSTDDIYDILIQDLEAYLPVDYQPDGDFTYKEQFFYLINRVINLLKFSDNDLH